MAPTLDKNHMKGGNIKSNNNHQRLPSSRDRHTINRRLLRRTLIQCRKHNRTTKVETPSLPAAPSVVYTPIRVSDYDASTNALAIGEKNSLRIIIRRHSDRKGILFEVRKQWTIIITIDFFLMMCEAMMSEWLLLLFFLGIRLWIHHRREMVRIEHEERPDDRY